MPHNRKPQTTVFFHWGSSAHSIIKLPSAGSNFNLTWIKVQELFLLDSSKMGNTGIVSILSSALGLILFILNVWFLQTIEIHGKPFEVENPQFNYTKWEEDRRVGLIWGTGASIGISIGIFQFLFSLVFVFQNMREQQEDRIWNLAAVILHVLFLFSITYSLAIAFHGLSKTEGTVGVLHISTIVCGVVETLFLIFYIVIFERECEYFGSIRKLFTCDEVKEKLAHYGIHKFRIPGSNIPMHRLDEETASMSV